jgi:hypothetical protein
VTLGTNATLVVGNTVHGPSIYYHEEPHATTNQSKGITYGNMGYYGSAWYQRGELVSRVREFLRGLSIEEMRRLSNLATRSSLGL